MKRMDEDLLQAKRRLVMGILNVTPDSFSDGGKFMSTEDALRQAATMIREGADLIDVGGESSRPGADPVPDDEQIRRTGPLIAALHRHDPEVMISIDTQSAAVAANAVEAGARMINDISALRSDSRMASLVADRGTYVVLMHMQGTPRTMQKNPHYDDVLGEIEAFFKERIEFAISSGIARERIVLDPGIGFGKTLEHNLKLITGLGRFAALAPVLLGTSLKSFLGRILGVDTPCGRLTGTIVSNAIGLLAGARILRVHDVREARQTIEMCAQMERYLKLTPL